MMHARSLGSDFLPLFVDKTQRLNHNLDGDIILVFCSIQTLVDVEPYWSSGVGQL